MQITCPLHMSPSDRAGCCTWDTFEGGFTDAWPRWFDVPPSIQQWQAARRDWRSGNTGWEAAHNAQRRAKERAATVSRLAHEFAAVMMKDTKDQA